MYSLKGFISGNAKLNGTIVPITKEVYKGPYQVKPSAKNQALDTKDKLMVDDLIVEAIPYAEVPNSANGTTIIIG